MVKRQLERGVRWSERNNSADTKISDKGGGGGARVARAENLSLQLVMKTMVRQVVPLQPWRPMVEHISTCSPWKWFHAEAGGCLKQDVALWGACQDPADPWRAEPMLEQVCWYDLWPCGGPTLEQPVPEGLHPMGRDQLWGSPWRAAARGKDSHRRSLWRAVSLERNLTLEQGQSLRSPPPEEEGAAKTTCDELTTAPVPCPPEPLGGEKGEKREVKLSPGRREGGGRCFKIWFYFSLSYSDLIGDELNFLFSLSSVCFVRDSNWWVISPCPYLDPRALHPNSSPLFSWGGGVTEQFWWAPGTYPGQSKTTTYPEIISVTESRWTVASNDSCLVTVNSK